MIRTIRHSDIDRERWDNCISRSGLDLLYSHTWYLDVVSPGWEALVMNDYEAVMPLTGKRKYGFCYLFQPFFAQQLGVFSTSGYSTELVDSFLDAIPGRFRLAEIQLNQLNHPEHKGFGFIVKKNHTLDLSAGYNSLYRNFSRNCRRNIAKAEGAGLTVGTDSDAGLFARFVRSHGSEQLKNDGTKIHNLLHPVVKASMDQGSGNIVSVFTKDGRKVAAAWFLKGPQRLFFQVCASTPEGKEHQAMYMLLNDVIKKNAASGLMLDFTGSVIPGVAYFNASFGATPDSYLAARYNRLPLVLRMFKK
ncbi:MAG: GNAT family N-acetyltransferase [Bacteroidales bacterium]|nr:GNAT family N-acetyltransferase [Bacteroidales bacterium]